MSLTRSGERGLLRALARRHRRVMPPPPRGPGDDAALVGPHLVTTDALVENVHFRRDEPAFLLGRKALAVNLSDVAAMGGRPAACLMTLAAPVSLPSSWLHALADGFASAAAESGVAWVGGDTVRSEEAVVISVTLLGEAGRRSLRRSGARPGDGIYVTGPLGASAAGRALLSAGWRVAAPGRAASRGWRWLDPVEGGRRLLRLVGRTPRGWGARAPRETVAALIHSHLDPVPRTEEALHLASLGCVSAAMDLSDGLSLDLARLCEESRCGAEILREAVPVAPGTRLWAAREGLDPVRHALDGGEDYELLFTVPRKAEKRLTAWPEGRPTGAFRIGRIRPRSAGIRLMDARGRTSRLTPGGYDAFRAHR